MAKAGWGYDEAAKRYRDLSNGRFLPNATITSLRDRVIESAARDARSLAQQAASGELTPAAFESGMRDLLRNVHGSEAIFGRGGVNAMTSADWGRVGATLKEQYGHLEKFAQQLGSTEGMTEARAMARAELYVGAAVKSYEQGRAAAFGIAGNLPGYPGDGETRCLGNCRCSWSITETDDAIEARWQTDAEPCPDCAKRATSWNPVVIPKVTAAAEAGRFRLVPFRRTVAA